MDTPNNGSTQSASGGIVEGEGRQSKPILEDSKQFLGRVIQYTTAALFVIDSSHTIQFWNNALAKMTGKSSFQMKGTKRHWSAFYESSQPLLADYVIDRHTTANDQEYEELGISRHAGGSLSAEGWYDNVGGIRRYLLFEAFPIIDGNNEVIAAVETIVDLTQRKEAQEVVESQRLFFQGILEALPNPVFFKDINHAYLGCNQAFSTFFGCAEEDIIGKTMTDFVPLAMARENIEYDDKVLNSRLVLNYETNILRCDDSMRVALVNKAPFYNTDNSLAGIVGSFVDVTEQRQLDEQVKKAKKEWEKTLDSLRDIVILADEEHRVRRCNRLLSEMSGKNYDELLGEDWRELLPAAGFETISFNGISGELIHHATQHYYGLNIYTMTEQGSETVTGYVVSLNDTTEIRAVNAELQRTASELNEAQRAVYQQEKMASIGQLAAGVAHEINNPMGFISSNLTTLAKYMDKIKTFEQMLSEVIEKRGDGEISAEFGQVRRKMKIEYIMTDIESLLNESRDGADRVRRIVQDLKSFSHVDDVECKPANINECLASTLNMARNEIKYVADVNLDFDENLPLLNCHPQQLNQVFMNLMVNAAHAIKDHGVITIKTYLEDNDIVIRVSDTGSGIAPENLTRIFEPFFTTKAVGKGTGLGLSISYDIIKKHGGNIGVESVLGSGTVFTIRLPVIQENS